MASAVCCCCIAAGVGAGAVSAAVDSTGAASADDVVSPWGSWGIVTGAPHLGHFRVWPASSSFALRTLPHPAHAIRIIGICLPHQGFTARINVASPKTLTLGNAPLGVPGLTTLVTCRADVNRSLVRQAFRSLLNLPRLPAYPESRDRIHPTSYNSPIGMIPLLVINSNGLRFGANGRFCDKISTAVLYVAINEYYKPAVRVH